MNQIKKHEREVTLTHLIIKTSERCRNEETDLLVSYGL